MKNLFKVMKELLDEKVKYYKTDFELDKKVLLRSQETTFYWFLRESGTELIEYDKLQYEGSEDYGTASYFIGSSDLTIYKISNVVRNQDSIIGEIKEINKEEVLKVLQIKKTINGADILMSFKDNTTVQGRYEGSCNQEIIKNALRQNKKNMEDINEFQVSSYF